MIDNINYATDIWWQVNIDNSTRTLSRKKIIKLFETYLNDDNIDKSEFNYDYLIRVPGQYGFYYSDEIVNKKLYSLAATIADKKENFAGILKLQEKYWVICCQNGLVVPQTDITFSTYESAEEHILKFVEKKDNAIIIILESSEVEKFITELGSPVGRIELIHQKLMSTRNILIGIGVFCLFSIYLWFQFLESREKEAIIQLQILEKNKIEAEIIEAKNHAEKYFLKPFESYHANANKNLLDYVTNDFNTIQKYQNGWEISKIVYDKDNREITWAGNGEYLDLPENARIGEKTGITSKKPIKYQWQAKNVFGKLNSQEQLQKYIYSIVAKTNINLGVSWKRAERKTIEIGRKEITLEAPWNVGDITLSNVTYDVLSNNNFKSVLSIYGLILESVTFENDVFTLRGKIYAKNRK